MIISRTPFRMSFFGGGTDYPDWFRQHGGAALATTINRYCYLTCRFLPQFFEHKSRIVWSRIEQVSGTEEIEHPAVRAVLNHLDIKVGVEIHHQGDLPAKTGLGSSSAFTVGLLHALHALKGKSVGRHDLAREAIYVEQTLLNETVGIQDQIQTAVGGLNHLVFHTDGTFSVHPVVLSPQRLRDFQDHFVLVFTGISRHASVIAAEQVANMPNRTSDLRVMHSMVDEGLKVLSGKGPLAEFGKLLHEGWKLKRTMAARISSSEIDDVYERGLRAGAYGGKLLGAGGGGFMLFCVAPEKRTALLDALRGLVHVPLEFERGGSQLIYYES